MKYKFEISIAEIKDLGCGPFEFKIALDSMEQHLYDTDTFEIYGEGSFALGILNNEEVIGGFRIPMSCLHRVSSQWFPVSLPYSELAVIPEFVEGPRVFLSLIEISILSPVQEHREMSEYSIESTPRVFSPVESKHEDFEPKDIYTAQLSQMLEINRKEINDLKDLAEENKKVLDKVMEENFKREEELVRQIKTAIEVNSRVESDNARLTAENLKLSIENQCLKNKYNTAWEELERTREIMKDSENKRKDLQSLLSSAHLKWQELKPNFSAVVTLEKENQNLLVSLKSANDKVKEVERSRIEEEGITALLSSLNLTISSLKIEVQELKNSNILLTEENSELKETVDRSRSISSKEPEHMELCEQVKNIPKTPNREDKIDKALREYMKESGISNPFSKVSEGVYQYQSKKISLSLKNGVPVIRVGGGYMFIDEFLKIYMGQSKKKPEEENSDRSHSLGGKSLKLPIDKFHEELDSENYPDMINTTPTASPLKRKTNENSIAYPTKSAILKKIPRLGNSRRELTPNSRRNRTPRQIFLP